VKQLRDAGAAPFVKHSLFEEQLLVEHAAQTAYVDSFEHTSAEATDFLPRPSEYVLGPAEYLEQIRKVKALVDVPVIGSLNGVTDSGWLDNAEQIQQAGADAIELNLYSLPTDPDESALVIEQRMIDMVRHVRRRVRIPVAVKLSPFFTSPVHVGRELVSAGADGLVVFNRFYQPDIDIEELAVEYSLELSSSSELRLRLRWLAILSARLGTSLAVTGGVHTSNDALKAVMAGAHAVQAVSAILKNGPGWIEHTRNEMSRWLTSHEYQSLEQARGSMNLSKCPDPGAYERGNYVRVLRAWTKLNLGF
jgi:dihydroorotate dehydrogenase (fumarate)